MKYDSSHYLRAVLEKFGPRGEHWTQQSYAKAANGGTVASDSKRAVRWCLLGSLQTVVKQDTHSYLDCLHLMVQAIARLYPRNIRPDSFSDDTSGQEEAIVVSFNDARYVEFIDVQSMMIEAIRLADALPANQSAEETKQLLYQIMEQFPEELESTLEKVSEVAEAEGVHAESI